MKVLYRGKYRTVPLLKVIYLFPKVSKGKVNASGEKLWGPRGKAPRIKKPSIKESSFCNCNRCGLSLDRKSVV